MIKIGQFILVAILKKVTRSRKTHFVKIGAKLISEILMICRWSTGSDLHGYRIML